MRVQDFEYSNSLFSRIEIRWINWKRIDIDKYFNYTFTLYHLIQQKSHSHYIFNSYTGVMYIMCLNNQKIILSNCTN